MKKEQINGLLKKFYEGNTSEEEEMRLGEELATVEEESPESDYFRFVKSQGTIPDRLKNDLIRNLDQKLEFKKLIRKSIISVVSLAALMVIFFSIFHDIRTKKKQNMADNFFVMEQALFTVSDIIKPEKQEEMVVLWIDNNVEIIIE